jgi:hypothetical protein
MHPRARDFIGAGLLFLGLSSLVVVLVLAEYLAANGS